MDEFTEKVQSDINVIFEKIQLIVRELHLETTQFLQSSLESAHEKIHHQQVEINERMEKQEKIRLQLEVFLHSLQSQYQDLYQGIQMIQEEQD